MSDGLCYFSVNSYWTTQGLFVSKTTYVMYMWVHYYKFEQFKHNAYRLVTRSRRLNIWIVARLFKFRCINYGHKYLSHSQKVKLLVVTYIPYSHT